MARPTIVYSTRDEREREPQPPPERLTLTWDEAADRIGISRRLLQDLVNDGHIRPIRVGTRVLFPIAELERWVDFATGKTFDTRR